MNLYITKIYLWSIGTNYFTIKTFGIYLSIKNLLLKNILPNINPNKLPAKVC